MMMMMVLTRGRNLLAAAAALLLGNAAAEWTDAAYAFETALHDSVYAVARGANGAALDDAGEDALAGGLGCFFNDIPGPKGNRIQALLASGKSFADMGNYDLCNKAHGTQYVFFFSCF
jgi:hypothetical protein